jgi:lipoprotein-anchoring transpeptidase ErfK/SrfK
MRFVLKLFLALGLLCVLQGRALAVVTVDVDLGAQMMHVHSSSGADYAWPISSGRAGHLTPRGVFRPRAMYTMVHSAKYNNAPMPHAIFFYGQYAIHGTNAVGALGSPASHGCIAVSREDPKILRVDDAKIVCDGR